jgi:hypothetical protein
MGKARFPERPIRTQLDQFAALVADSAGTKIDGNVAAIARQMGLEGYRGNSLMQQLRRQIGPNQCV